MKDPIKVLVKKTGQKPTVEIIENDLKSLQAIVGGYIEMPYNSDFSKGLQLVCNEEGLLMEDTKPNVRWGDSDIVFGDILFIGIDDDGETISLTLKQIDKAKKWIAENDVSKFMGDPEELTAENCFVEVFEDENHVFIALFTDKKPKDMDNDKSEDMEM